MTLNSFVLLSVLLYRLYICYNLYIVIFLISLVFRMEQLAWGPSSPFRLYNISEYHVQKNSSHALWGGTYIRVKVSAWQPMAELGEREKPYTRPIGSPSPLRCSCLFVLRLNESHWSCKILHNIYYKTRLYSLLNWAIRTIDLCHGIALCDIFIEGNKHKKVMKLIISTISTIELVLSQHCL